MIDGTYLAHRNFISCNASSRYGIGLSRRREEGEEGCQGRCQEKVISPGQKVCMKMNFGCGIILAVITI